MSLLDRAEELKDIPDAQLAQLVKQGSEAGDTWLAATETQRRKDMRARYAAEAAKQQAANPPSVLEQRAAELGGGIPSADPNMQGPDPSLQTGIAGPPPGMARGGLIRGYQQGARIDPDRPLPETREEIIAYQEELAKNQAAYQRYRQDIPTRRSGMTADPDDRTVSFFRPAPPVEGEPGFDPEEWESPEEATARWWQAGGEDADPRGLVHSKYYAWQTPAEIAQGKREVAGRAEEDLELAEFMRGLDPTLSLAEAQQRISPETVEPYEWDNRRQLEELLAKDEISQSAYDAGMANLLTGSAARDPETGELLGRGDPDDDLAFLESLRIRGGSGSGLPTLAETYEEGRGHIRDYQDLMGESDEDREYNRLRRLATARDRERAGGIHSLEQERIQEEERLLADSLGISEERMRELMREMDTPEEVKNRRESAGYGALRSMFLSPDLATGIGGMGKQITDMDDILRAERKTALGDIFEQREAGAELEREGRKGIFDLTRSSQKSLDTADAAIDNMESTIAKATAEFGRAGQEEAMKSFIDLLKNQAQHIGAWDATMAQITAQMQEATVNRDNPMMQAEAWEKIEMGLDDWVNRITDGPDGPEYKMWQRAVKVKDAALGTLIIKSGESIVEDDQGVGVPTSGRADRFTVPNFSFSSSSP